MRTTSNKKSPKARPSATRRKARLAIKPVSVEAARHLAKPRTGFEALVEPLAALVAKYPAEFSMGIDADRMVSSLTAYQDLASDYEAAVAVLAKVENARLVHASTAWTEVLAIYDRGKSLARGNEDIQVEIDPVARFMKVGPRKPRKATPPPAPVTTTGTPTTTP